MPSITIDTSAIISVIANEPSKRKVVDAAKGFDLVAPFSVHWEIGNAFSALFKRSLTSLVKAEKALTVYESIPIRFIEVELSESLRLAESAEIYAYDAYVLACSSHLNAPILTLDRGLIAAAEKLGIPTLEISQ